MSKTNEKFGYQGQKLYNTSLRQFYNTNEPNTNKIHKPLTKHKNKTNNYHINTKYIRTKTAVN